tara:strand:+ start:999 stop:1220 length:222 start_codon:yes stop_codon:yes gene_type:complete
MSNRRIPVLDFQGNGSIVDTAGLKQQAGKAPSAKLQASSAKPVRQIVARQYVLLTKATSTKLKAPSATNHGSV